jgi:outer membrane protein TolC
MYQGTDPAFRTPSERGAALNESMISRVFRTIVTVLLVGVLQGGSVLADEPVIPENPNLDDYLAVANQARPVLEADRSRADALRSSADRAGAMPSLRLAWGEMIVPVETRVGPQQRIFSISQSIPWFGTLGLQSEAAGARADAADSRVDGRTLAVRREIRGAWLELAYLERAVETMAGHLDLATQAEEVTRSAYEAGEASYADLLTAQIELGRLETDLAGLKDRRHPVTVRLNVAAGLDPSHPAPMVLDIAAVDDGRDLPDLETLKAILESNNPELEARRHEQESRRHGVDIAGRSSYPDLSIGLDYIMTGPAEMEGVEDSGKDPVIARVAVSIPLWGGQADAERRTSAGLVRAAGADLADVRLRLLADLESAHFELRDSARREALYTETMITRGRQALEVTAARYASGQASYQDLVQARRTLLDLELSRLRAAADRRLAWNDLITLLGLDPARQEG